jgi:putative oxidoreductase
MNGSDEQEIHGLIRLKAPLTWIENKRFCQKFPVRNKRCSWVKIFASIKRILIQGYSSHLLFAHLGSELAREGISMFRKLIATDSDFATTILRLVLGVIFFAHGAQKALGWFGGYGFTGTMGFFTGVLHIPAVFAFLAIAAEFLGGLGLILGLLTRVASFGIFCNMVVAIAMVHGRFGFFMNWTGAQKGEGYEYHLLVLATTAFLMIRGAGTASVDRLLSSRANSGIKAQPRPQAA